MRPIFVRLTILICFFQMTVLSGQTPNNDQLFNHAKMAPDSVESNFLDLALYLKGPAKNDKEAVETIFYWMATNITYFNDPYLELDYSDNIAETTLLTKKSGCEGNARLFYELCKAIQIECEVIFGYAEGYRFDSEQLSKPNHGWNAVKINDKWELVDATWGSGGSIKVGDSKSYVPDLDLRYLFADPEDFIIDHFPLNARWQLLDKPISKRTFYSDEFELKRLVKLVN